MSALNLVQGFFTETSLTTTSANQVLSANGINNKAIKYVINATHQQGHTYRGFINQ